MRGPDTFTESLFTLRKLEDFVPSDHPLRPIRQMVNAALVKMDALFSGMYEADIKGGRPSIAPEKLLRAMLLQVFYSVRSERQLMEQTQYNLLFRWFIGLSMDDAVWVPTVFTKNRERLIEHDAVIELFNLVLEQAEHKGLLSGEHFSVDGTLIQAWAGHKSFVRKDGADDDSNSSNFKDQSRSNDTHVSNTDADARLYCKGDNASRLRYMGHTLTDNRHGLVANAMVTTADGFAEREAAKTMIDDARQAADNPQAEVTLGADKGYDAKEFIDACLEMNVIPHVAQKHLGAPLRGAGCNCCQCGLRHLGAEEKTHRARLRVGKDRGAHPAGDGARVEEGRSNVCADHGGLQPHAHAYAGKNPSADGVKGGKCGEMRLKRSKTSPKRAEV
jgi:transposase